MLPRGWYVFYRNEFRNPGAKATVPVHETISGANYTQFRLRVQFGNRLFESPGHSQIVVVKQCHIMSANM